MQFSSKQVVAMIGAVCAAVVLAPVGVMAATGELVNIVDPLLSSRQVRVGSGGSLQVETRPGVTHGAVNVTHLDIAGLETKVLMEVTAPTRIALTEITVLVRKFGSPVVAPTIVNIVRYVRNSGTNPCGGTGWAPTVLRRFSVKTEESVQLTFDGPPLMVDKGTSGQRVCLVAKLYQWVGDTRVDIGATVFSFQ